MFLASFVFLLCLWLFKVRFDPTAKWMIAGSVAWGGFCVFFFGYFLRNVYGQHVEIDPVQKTLRILKDSFGVQPFPWLQDRQ